MPKRRPWPRRLLRAFLALTAVGVLLSLAALVALRSPRVQRALIERLSRQTESSFGFSVEAASLRLRPLTGSLEAENLVLRVDDGPPFARVRTLRATWSAGALLRRPFELASLELLEPTVDLTAPTPRSTGEEEPTPAAERAVPLALRRLEIDGGRVVGAPIGSTLDGWRGHDLSASGSFDGRRLELDRMRAKLEIAPGWRDGGPLEIELELAGSAALDASAEVRDLRLEGPGLSVLANARLEPGAASPRAAFEIEADPGIWLSGAASGTVEARGEIDLGAWEGSVAIAGPGQPASLLAPFLPAALGEKLELADTVLDIEADLRLVDERAVGGSSRLVLARAGSTATPVTVLELSLQPWIELSEDLPARLLADADLLPGAPGTRRVTARLATPRAREAEAWSIDAATFRLAEQRPAATLAAFAALYPRLLPSTALAELPRLGSLSIEGGLEGRVTAPRLSADALLSPPGGGRVEVTARGPLRHGELRVGSTGRQVELASWTEAVAGRLDWSAVIDDALGAPSGTLEVTAGPLTAAGEPLLESLSASVSGDRTDLVWRADARTGDGVDLVTRGRLVPAVPLARAAGELRVADLAAAVPSIDATFDLAGGVLGAQAEVSLAGRPPANLEARVPLAALRSLPGAAVLDALPLPLAMGDGAIEVEWRTAPGPWLDLMPSAAGRIDRLSAGARGRLVLTPATPAASTLEATFDELDLAIDGRALRADPLRLSLADARLGFEPLTVTGAGLTIGAAAHLDLARGWRFGDPFAALGERLDATLAAEAASDWLESLPLVVESPGTLRLDARLEGPLDRLSGRAEVAAPGVVVTAQAFPHTPLALLGAEVVVEDGTARWRDVRLDVGAASLASQGSTRLGAPLDEAAGEVTVDTGLPVLEGLRLPFTLRRGVLAIDEGVVATPGGEGEVSLALPLDETAGEDLRASWSLPLNDWAPLLHHLGEGEDPERFEAALSGYAEGPWRRPAELSASLTLDSARVVARGRETRVEPALRVTLADGTARVEPLELRSAGETFSFAAIAELDRGWSPGDPPTELVSSFSVLGDGRLDAALLNPFLAGGRADGPLDLELELGGRPRDWDGRVSIDGPEASVLFRGTYLVRIERPDLELAIRDGLVRLERGSAAVNEGEMELSGLLWDGERGDLSIGLSNALMRLDYGLLTTLGSDLRLSYGGGEDMRLAGTVDVERGYLTRTLRPDLDFLTGLLSPVDLSTTEEGALDLLQLDLEIRTREGVRVANNLAELLVRWEPLRVTGTAARPVIDGRLEADPGGLLFLYGQTVRLDSAAIEYPGIEGADARLDFEATTSLEDPTIGRLAGDDPFRSTQRGEAPPAADATGDLARYLGESLAGRVGEAVGVKLSLRPILIFGETDPGGRLTVTRDLSPYLALAASIDLRQAEAQTYLLEAHELEALPRLVTQIFSDDQSSYGTVLLQRREFGGTRPAADSDEPRAGKILVRPPPGVSRRGVRRALELDRGEVLDADRLFAAEIELTDYLRRKGYADAEVTVEPAAGGRKGRRTPVAVSIDAGPRAFYEFSGEKLPGALRQLITDLYRADFFEPESIAEMRAETVRALRSRGFLDPQVSITVTPLDPALPEGDRLVSIHTEGGVRLSPRPPEFLGLPPEDVAVLDALFFNSVQRVELAVGLPSADRRLLNALAGLGYPEARIASRYQSLRERALTVEIDPGPRQQIERVAVVAAAEDTELPDDLESVLRVSAGDPLLRSSLARSATAIERELGARGHRDARVQTVVEPVAGNPYALEVRFAVAPGPVSRVEAVRFTGLRSTREAWARRVVDLEPGQVLARDDLPRARTRLWRTGLFSAVSTETTAQDAAATEVRFDLAERPRFRLAYGVRWDSETGLGTVVDATDDNFRGRGWTLGLRALHSSEEKSLRWLTRIPRVFGGAGSLEVYASASRLTEKIFDRFFGEIEVVNDIREATVQFSRPLSEAATMRLYGRYVDTVSETLFITEEITDPALGAQLLYDTRSAEPVIRRGIFASVDLSGSEEVLGGDLRYLRLFSQLHLHRPLGSRPGRLGWSHAYRLGLAEPFDQQLIRSVRFFAGGEYSVRGYATESLGEQGLLAPEGGAALAVVNQELRWSPLEDYTLIFFADAGEVWPTIGELDFDLRTSVGLGLRAITPIGLVRLDLARALDRRPDIDPEFKLYFGLGTVF